MGPMGSRKSTIGKILSKELNLPYIDNDEELKAATGMSVENLGDLEIDHLHNLEQNIFDDIIDRPAPFIASLAASTIEDPANQARIKNEYGIYLRRPLHDLVIRAGTQGIGRQTLRGASDGEIRDRFNRRDPLYKGSAKFVVELTKSTPFDAQKIIEELQKA